MNAARRFAVAFCASLLGLSLLVLPWAHVATETIRDRDTVKNWLDKSGFYEKVVLGLLESAESSEGNVPVDDPQVVAIAQEAFSPAYLKENTEKILDGTFAWLEGDTEAPEFTLDISDAKLRLADGIGAYATRRAAELPVCTPAQLQEFTDGFDVFSAPCVPPGVSAAQAGETLRNQVLASDQFLSDTTITGEDLTKPSAVEGQPAVSATEDLKSLPEAYQAGGTALWLSLALVVLSAAGAFFLSSTRRSGVWRVGVIVVTSGVIIGISFLLIDRGSAWLENRAQTLGGDNSVSQDLLAGFVREVSQDVGVILGWYALGYLLFGTAVLLFAKFYGWPKAPHLRQGTDPEPPVDDSPRPALSETTAKQDDTPGEKPATKA